jgi:ribonucleoside-diphosphate reductase alpha chain
MDGDADSYGAIIRIDEEQVQLMKRRGGVGHDLSHIRPKGSPVKNSALTSTGLVPFMERYSNSTREVAQDGRRGALMLSVSIKHPDSEDFINAKLEQGKVTGANISVKIDDGFMEAASEGKPYVQKFPIDSDKPKYEKTIDAERLWKKMCTMPGNRPNQACCFGIPLSASRSPTVMPIWVSEPYRPIRAVKFRCVLMTVAACWLSTFIPMW